MTQLVGKLSSTLGASSLENFSTVSGRHSFSETVFLFSLSLLRLIGSFHGCTSFIKIDVGTFRIPDSFAYSYESRVYYIAKNTVCQDKKQKKFIFVKYNLKEVFIILDFSVLFC